MMKYMYCVVSRSLRTIGTYHRAIWWLSGHSKLESTVSLAISKDHLELQSFSQICGFAKFHKAALIWSERHPSFSENLVWGEEEWWRKRKKIYKKILRKTIKWTSMSNCPIAHLSRPWSIGWVALSFLVRCRSSSRYGDIRPILHICQYIQA